jgi:transglutaminase/protease-like cytokinesis protein 3
MNRINLEKEYQKQILRIANEIKNAKTFITKKEQLRLLYEWFINNTKYDSDILNNRNELGLYTNILYNYNGYEFYSNEKYAPILLHKGTCVSFSKAFKDICDELNIECRVVSSKDSDATCFKSEAHSWNEVVLDGNVYTVDLTFKNFLSERRTKPLFQIRK